jgi:BlaI family transcriptional regulator, penicillinase repressor
MPIKPPLSGLEQEVMEIVWSRGGVSATDVQDALEASRTLRYSTVRTILTRLEDKGYVQHEVSGRTFVYSSVEPPRNLAVRAVRQLVDRFCRGSVESLLVGMVDDEMVDPAELRRIVDRLSAQAKAKGRKAVKRKRSSATPHQEAP